MIGKDIQAQFGIDAMEVTDEVFESTGVPSSSTRAENRLHHHQGGAGRHPGRLSCCLAALGGNALLMRGQPLYRGVAAHQWPSLRCPIAAAVGERRAIACNHPW